MENKSHALAAGTFVLVVLALLISLAAWLTRDNRSLRTFEITSMQAVTGLQPQATVRFKGVKIGKVSSIGFNPQLPGQVLVRIAIDEQAPITASTFATLGFQGVTGLAFVQLDDPGNSPTLLATDPLKPTRIPMQPGLVSKLSDQGELILSELLLTTRQFNQLLSPENQKAMLSAMGSIDRMASRADAVLAQEARTAFKAMTDMSARVGSSADEARASARAFRTVTERMNAPGGMLDQLGQSTATITTTGQAVNATTLPRLNRALTEAGMTVRQLGHAADSLTDNPQSLLFGNKRQVPGPGEPGFSTPAAPP